MSEHLELIHTEENDPVYYMPYTPAIKVRSGATVYVAGVTAAPVYHHHPHRMSDFENIPLDPGDQARMAMGNLRNVVQAAGGELTDIVQLFRFICDIDKNQDAINKAMGDGSIGKQQAFVDAACCARPPSASRLPGSRSGKRTCGASRS